MSIVQIIFYILAAITLSTAFLTIYSKNPIHSAIYLVLCFFLYSRTLFAFQCAVFSYSSYHRILGCHYGSFLIHHHVDESE